MVMEGGAQEDGGTQEGAVSVGGVSFAIGIDLTAFERQLDQAEGLARARVANIQQAFDSLKFSLPSPPQLPPPGPPQLPPPSSQPPSGGGGGGIPPTPLPRYPGNEPGASEAAAANQLTGGGSEEISPIRQTQRVVTQQYGVTIGPQAPALVPAPAPVRHEQEVETQQSRTTLPPPPPAPVPPPARLVQQRDVVQDWNQILAKQPEQPYFWQETEPAVIRARQVVTPGGRPRLPLPPAEEQGTDLGAGVPLRPLPSGPQTPLSAAPTRRQTITDIAAGMGQVPVSATPPPDTQSRLIQVQSESGQTVAVPRRFSQPSIIQRQLPSFVMGGEPASIGAPLHVMQPPGMTAPGQMAPALFVPPASRLAAPTGAGGSQNVQELLRLHGQGLLETVQHAIQLPREALAELRTSELAGVNQVTSQFQRELVSALKSILEQRLRAGGLTGGNLPPEINNLLRAAPPPPATQFAPRPGEEPTRPTAPTPPSLITPASPGGEIPATSLTALVTAIQTAIQQTRLPAQLQPEQPEIPGGVGALALGAGLGIGGTGLGPGAQITQEESTRRLLRSLEAAPPPGYVLPQVGMRAEAGPVELPESVREIVSGRGPRREREEEEEEEEEERPRPRLHLLQPPGLFLPSTRGEGQEQIQNFFSDIMAHPRRPAPPEDIEEGRRERLESQIPARERGGPAQSDQPYLVGERGPELFVPKQAGYVLPADKTRTALAHYQGGGAIATAERAVVGEAGSELYIPGPLYHQTSAKAAENILKSGYNIQPILPSRGFVESQPMRAADIFGLRAAFTRETPAPIYGAKLGWKSPQVEFGLEQPLRALNLGQRLVEPDENKHSYPTLLPHLSRGAQGQFREMWEEFFPTYRHAMRLGGSQSARPYEERTLSIADQAQKLISGDLLKQGFQAVRYTDIEPDTSYEFPAVAVLNEKLLKPQRIIQTSLPEAKRYLQQRGQEIEAQLSRLAESGELDITPRTAAEKRQLYRATEQYEDLLQAREYTRAVPRAEGGPVEPRLAIQRHLPGFGPSGIVVPGRKLTEEDITRAAQITPGAQLTSSALSLDVSRRQHPAQGGERSLRSGVFYLAEGTKSPYTGKFGYGGEETIKDRITLPAPTLAVKGGMGGAIVAETFESILGKGSAQRALGETREALPWGEPNSITENHITRLFMRYGVDEQTARADAQNILSHSNRKTNQAYTAIYERVAAEVARHAGYQAVVGISPRTKKFGEVFDLREEAYPYRLGERVVHQYREAEPRALGGPVRAGGAPKPAPELVVADLIRQRGRQGQITSDEFTDLFKSAGLAVPGGGRFEGTRLPSLQDLNAAVEAGHPFKDWFTDFARGTHALVGAESFNEARVILGISSAQTNPATNLAHTLLTMRWIRQLEAAHDPVARRVGPADVSQYDAEWRPGFERAKAEGKTGRDLPQYRPPRVGNWRISDELESLWKAEPGDIRSQLTRIKLNDIAEAYATGQTSSGGYKTPSYSSNLQSSLLGLPDLNSTIDTWIGQVFGFQAGHQGSARAAADPALYRAMHGAVMALGEQHGLTGYQAQSTLWAAIRNISIQGRAGQSARYLRPASVRDEAALAASTAPQDIMRSLQRGLISLGEAVGKAQETGIYDKPAGGTFAEAVRNPQVQAQVAQLRPFIESGKLRPSRGLLGQADLVFGGKQAPGVPPLQASYGLTQKYQQAQSLGGHIDPLRFALAFSEPRAEGGAVQPIQPISEEMRQYAAALSPRARRQFERLEPESEAAAGSLTAAQRESIKEYTMPRAAGHRVFDPMALRGVFEHIKPLEQPAKVYREFDLPKSLADLPPEQLIGQIVPATTSRYGFASTALERTTATEFGKAQRPLAKVRLLPGEEAAVLKALSGEITVADEVLLPPNTQLAIRNARRMRQGQMVLDTLALESDVQKRAAGGEVEAGGSPKAGEPPKETYEQIGARLRPLMKQVRELGDAAPDELVGQASDLLFQEQAAFIKYLEAKRGIEPRAEGGPVSQGGHTHQQTATNEPGIVAGLPMPWDLKAPAPARYTGDTSIYSPAVPTQKGQYLLGRRIQGKALVPADEVGTSDLSLNLFVPRVATVEQQAQIERTIQQFSDHAQLHEGIMERRAAGDQMDRVEGSNYWIRGKYADLSNLAQAVGPQLTKFFGPNQRVTFMQPSYGPKGPTGEPTIPIREGEAAQHLRVVVPFTPDTPPLTVGNVVLSDKDRDRIASIMSGKAKLPVVRHLDFNGEHIYVQAKADQMDQIQPQVETLIQQLSGKVSGEHNVGATRFVSKNVNVERYPVIELHEGPRPIGFPAPRAAGGPADQKMPYLVGERGPELFVPEQAGYVLSHEQTQKALGGPVPRQDGGPVEADAGAALRGFYESVPPHVRRQYFQFEAGTERTPFSQLTPEQLSRVQRVYEREGRPASNAPEPILRRRRAPAAPAAPQAPAAEQTTPEQPAVPAPEAAPAVPPAPEVPAAPAPVAPAAPAPARAPRAPRARRAPAPAAPAAPAAPIVEAPVEPSAITAPPTPVETQAAPWRFASPTPVFQPEPAQPQRPGLLQGALAGARGLFARPGGELSPAQRQAMLDAEAQPRQAVPLTEDQSLAWIASQVAQRGQAAGRRVAQVGGGVARAIGLGRAAPAQVAPTEAEAPAAAQQAAPAEAPEVQQARKVKAEALSLQLQAAGASKAQADATALEGVRIAETTAQYRQYVKILQEGGVAKRDAVRLTNEQLAAPPPAVAAAAGGGGNQPPQEAEVDGGDGGDGGGGQGGRQGGRRGSRSNLISAIRGVGGLIGIPIGINVVAGVAREIHQILTGAVEEANLLAQSGREIGVNFGLAGTQIAASFEDFRQAQNTVAGRGQFQAVAASLAPLADQYQLTSKQVLDLTTASDQLAVMHGVTMPQSMQVLQQVLRGNIEAGQQLDLQLVDQYGALKNVGLTTDELSNAVGTLAARQIILQQIQGEVQRQNDNNTQSTNAQVQATQALTRAWNDFGEAAAAVAQGPVLSFTRDLAKVIQAATEGTSNLASALNKGFGGGGGQQQQPLSPLDTAKLYGGMIGAGVVAGGATFGGPGAVVGGLAGLLAAAATSYALQQPALQQPPANRPIAGTPQVSGTGSYTSFFDQGTHTYVYPTAGTQGRAAGGAVTTKPYLVGERGPELFLPDQPGYVLSHDETQKALQAGATPRQDGGDVLSAIGEARDRGAAIGSSFPIGVGPIPIPLGQVIGGGAGLGIGVASQVPQILEAGFQRTPEAMLKRMAVGAGGGALIGAAVGGPIAPFTALAGAGIGAVGGAFAPDIVQAGFQAVSDKSKELATNLKNDSDSYGILAPIVRAASDAIGALGDSAKASADKLAPATPEQPGPPPTPPLSEQVRDRPEPGTGRTSAVAVQLEEQLIPLRQQAQRATVDQAEAQGRLDILDRQSKMRQLEQQPRLNALSAERIDIENQLAPILLRQQAIQDQITIGTQENLNLTRTSLEAQRGAVQTGLAATEAAFPQRQAEAEMRISMLQAIHGVPQTFDLGQSYGKALQSALSVSRAQAEYADLNQQNTALIADAAVRNDQLTKAINVVPLRQMAQNLLPTQLGLSLGLAGNQAQTESINRFLQSMDLMFGDRRIAAETALTEAMLAQADAAEKIAAAGQDFAKAQGLPPVTISNNITLNGFDAGAIGTPDGDAQLQRIRDETAAGIMDAITRAGFTAPVKISTDVASAR